MPIPRKIETDQGIQGEFNVQFYDQMQRRLRDKGYIETRDIIKSGITSGLALEVGPGPGCLGLEWLKLTQGTMLKGLDISPDMIKIAEKNAEAFPIDSYFKYSSEGIFVFSHRDRYIHKLLKENGFQRLKELKFFTLDDDEKDLLLKSDVVRKDNL